MKKKLTILVCFGLLTTLAGAQVVCKKTTLLMGGRFDFTIVAADTLTAQNNIASIIKEIDRIEYLISDWKASTQVAEINRNAGIKPVKVDKEVFELAKRAIQLSEATQGAFDISFAAMEKIWKFDGSMVDLPSPEAIKKSVEKVGYRNILLDKEKSTVFLRLPGMKIGFGALGEGYAADRCRKMMLDRGIKAGIVNASGDMTVWGRQPNGKRWTVGITNPVKKDTVFALLAMKKAAIVTSGNYQKFALIDGKRYAHIINPATGYPATGLCSVTVMGPSAELANGLSTSMMVLGKDKAFALLKSYPDYSAIVIDDNGHLFSTKDLRYLVKKAKF